MEEGHNDKGLGQLGFTQLALHVMIVYVFLRAHTCNSLQDEAQTYTGKDEFATGTELMS